MVLWHIRTKRSCVILCRSIRRLWPRMWGCRLVSALCEASCLCSDVREQDSAGGNTDDRTLLTLLNLRTAAPVRSPDSHSKPSDWADSYRQHFGTSTATKAAVALVVSELIMGVQWGLEWVLSVLWGQCVGKMKPSKERGSVCSWRMFDRKCQRHIWNSYTFRKSMRDSRGHQHAACPPSPGQLCGGISLQQLERGALVWMCAVPDFIGCVK